MEIKSNDVYRFCYNDEWKKKIFDPNWCFDGKLVVKERNDRLYLEDTYWSYGDNKTFTIEEALEKGSLTFICNLDDVVECRKYDTQYYADEDIFDLSYQHHCYEKYCIKKNAKRSAEKMKEVLKEKIEDEERKIRWATSSLKSYKAKLQEVENGNLDIYI